MNTWKSCLVGACVVAAGLSPALARAATSAYKYVVTVTVASPKGAAIDTTTKPKPTNIRFVPCDSGKLDQLSFSFKFDAGSDSTNMKDTYFFFYNLEADGTGVTSVTQAKYYPVSKRFVSSAAGGLVSVGKNAQAFNPETDAYVAAKENVGSAQTDLILGGNLDLTGLPQGTWLAVGLVADRSTVSIDDPATWLAWDAAPLVVGTPWKTGSNGTCQ